MNHAPLLICALGGSLALAACAPESSDGERGAPAESIGTAIALSPSGLVGPNASTYSWSAVPGARRYRFVIHRSTGTNYSTNT
jgi:hypothetical protein